MYIEVVVVDEVVYLHVYALSIVFVEEIQSKKRYLLMLFTSYLVEGRFNRNITNVFLSSDWLKNEYT